MTQATRPVCSMPGCDQEIWYKPEENDVCAGCRKRGGPPPPPAPEPEPEPLWYELRPDLMCSSPECGRAITAPHRTGKVCMRCFLQQRTDLVDGSVYVDTVQGQTYNVTTEGKAVMHCQTCAAELTASPGEVERMHDADGQPNCGCRLSASVAP